MEKCYMDKCNNTYPPTNIKEGDCCVIYTNGECKKGKYYKSGSTTINGVTTPVYGCRHESNSEGLSTTFIIILVVGLLLLLLGAYYLIAKTGTGKMGGPSGMDATQLLTGILRT